MTYRIIYAPSFRDDLDQQVEYLINEKVTIAIIDRWFTRLYELIDGLCETPRRFSVDTIQTAATGLETRKLIVDDYLVFYQVDDERQKVNVVGFVHGARRREP